MRWPLRATGLALGAALLAAALPSRVATPLRAQAVQTPDPCSSVAASSLRSAAPAARATGPARAAKTGALDHDDRWSHLDSLWNHRAAVSGRRVSTRTAGTRSQDIGEIAVLEDAGDLMILANPLDLSDAALRLTPNDRGGYDVAHRPYDFLQPLGSVITLADDDSRAITLPFTFTFFGQDYPRVFVNSDGNLTFVSPDSASSERSVARLLTGAPRIAPFFADLDPSVGGSVLTSSNAGAFTVTWCGVPAWGGVETATVQVTMFRDGTLDMQVSGLTTILDAVVGVSPGATGELLPVDLSDPAPIAAGPTAVAERFTSTSSLDLIGVSRRFISTHTDTFEGLTIFTDQPLLTDAFAVETTIANYIQGLGLPTYNYSGEFGSNGRLRSISNMDLLGKYPENPRQRFLGENSAVSVMAQEFGHRWLAFHQFREPNGQPSNALLGRDFSHWSFFLDSDASVMGGNDIVDLGHGSFRTAGAVSRYSLLDQYAMGLVDQTEVPPFFYVQNPTDVVPDRTATSEPRVGVTFSGERRDITIDDIIAAMGPRIPSAAESPRELRQAFIYVTSRGRPIDAGAVRKLDAMRIAFGQFVSEATDSRLRLTTRLEAVTP